jgi:hypothetical protein
MLGALKRLFGSKHERDVKILRPIADEINVFYEEYQKLSDDELRAKTDEFRARIKEAIRETEADVQGAREKLQGELTPDERERSWRPWKKRSTRSSPKRWRSFYPRHLPRSRTPAGVSSGRPLSCWATEWCGT